MAGVDGVAAVAYGTPESAAAILAASESVSGVRGGLGGGGAGAASLAVGEQLQNMVGGPGGWGRGGGAAPSDGSRHAEWCAARSCLCTCVVWRASGAARRAESRGDFEVLVCYMTLAGAAAPHRVFALERSARHQPALPYTLCDTLKTSYRRAGLGGSRKPCQSLRRAF